MRKSKLLQSKLSACLACLALALCGSAASGASLITVLGSAPVPGPNDQYQMTLPPGPQQPGNLNYYLGANPVPGQTFTTGSNPGGYTLDSLALYQAGGTGGGWNAQNFTLGIFTVSGSTATLVATYNSQSVLLTSGAWFQWTGLGAILQPNTQYAYAMQSHGSGWANLGNISGNHYAAGEVVSIPIAGGTITLNTPSGYDATFDVGLTAITGITVSQPIFSSQTVAPGATVTASASVGGATPYYYQWQTDGGSGGTLTNIPNATNATLSLNTTGMAAGIYNYDLVVSNATSSATSAPASLTVVQGIPDVIGIKFGFTGGFASSVNLDPFDVAGVVPVPGWNNLLANLTSSATVADRQAAINQTWNIAQDSAGNALSGVTLTALGFNDGWYSGGTGCPNARLLYSCWKWNSSNGYPDNASGAAGLPRYYVTLTLSHLPKSRYDVYLYVNNNSGNYWGNAEANSVFAVGTDIDYYGFAGDNADPTSLNPQLHTASGYSPKANYVKMPFVAPIDGAITITVAADSRIDFGVSGVELVPSTGIIMNHDTWPSSAETVVGDQVVFTAAFYDNTAVNLQWQKISGGATNNVNTGGVTVTNNGVVTSTLTLNNVQLTDSGSYQLKAVNAANNSQVAYSTPAELAVANSPAPVNNVIANYAGQVVPQGGLFYPPWTISTNSLIYGFQPFAAGPGTSTAVGDFSGNNACYINPNILSDGISAIAPTSTQLCAGGSGANAGNSITYTLDTSSAVNGFEITNITVFGGWTGDGRDEQKYQVLYSTVSAPATFLPLLTVDYNPADATGGSSVTRTTLVPATGGVLMHNVAAVEFNFDQSPKNGWEGYSEIVVAGRPSAALAPSIVQDILPQKAVDVVGAKLVLLANFTNYTGLQWQFNGTNIPGATATNLVLNNLQLTNSGNYAIVASNAAGSTFSSACAVTVNPVPPATNNAVISIAEQSAPYSFFAPTWDASALSTSLIYNTAPSSAGSGDFTATAQGVVCGGPVVLTDGTFGLDDFPTSGSALSFTAMGTDSTVGNYVIYTLPASAHGYDITNIVVCAGWPNAGRDMLAYTVFYATTANPTFLPLAAVSHNPANPNGISFDKATIAAASGVLASNVVALKFDMTSPDGENGWSGYSEISVGGSPSASAQTGPIVTASDENLSTPDWVVETPNLIAGQLPSSSVGDFTGGAGCNGVSVLTDGTIGDVTALSNLTACGSGASQSLIYTAATGWNLTNIVVYSGWMDGGRDGQFYNLSYSTLSAPTNFIPLVSVGYNPPRLTGAMANRVAIAPPTGQTTLAANVAAVKFDFTPQIGGSAFDNWWSGYAEIVLQGSSLPPSVSTPPTVHQPVLSGGKLTVTGSGGTPNGAYTWLSTTSLTPPVQWTTNSTGTLDGAGAFSNSIPINPATPASFFRLRMP